MQSAVSMNWRLLFTGTQSLSWTVSVVLAVLVTLVLCLRLSQLERQLVSRRVGRALLCLRVLVLVLLLLTLLQPVLTRTWDLHSRGRVVVAIDTSHSMDTRDRHATAAEKLRWAQALGMLGTEQSAPLLEAWVAALESGQQPNWLGTESGAEVADNPLSESRRRQVQAALDELSEMPRVEFVRRLLQAQPRQLLKQLGDVMPLDLRLFAAEQQSVDAARLQDALQSPSPDLILGGTDTVGLLNSLLSEESGAQIRGIILLSDGRQTAAGDPATEARRLGSLNVPVYSIPVGSRLPPRDLSVAAVEAPETVFINDQAQVQATIGTSGFEGQELQVRLEQGGATIDQQRITPAGDTATIRFTIPSSALGRFDYQIATAVQPGELREDNNVRSFSLQVVDNKARVLLVEGDARWEFRYLRNLLERDPQVALSSVLFRQPHLQLLTDTFISRTLPDTDALREQLAATDILIIGDVQPADVSDGVWNLIEQAVADEGLTLVVIPGRHSMPHAFTSDKLAGLLPVQDVQQRLAEKFAASQRDADQSAFRLQPTAEAEQLPMFQPPQPGQPSALATLPGHPWASTATPRPSAVVWAWAVLDQARDVREPVIVHQYYGFGQVVWMGVDSTWRWRRRLGDSQHHRFWGQLVRWAARNKSASGNDQVRLTLSDVVLDETERAEAVARFSDKALRQLQGAAVEVVLTPLPAAGGGMARDADGAAPAAPGADAASTAAAEQVVVLQPSAEHPERYLARLPRLTAGAWRAQLRVRDSQLQLNSAIASELLVQPQQSAELADVSCNRELLQQLADFSGGRLIEPWQVDELAALIQPADQAAQKLEEQTLWDHWLTLLLFFTCLMCEWVLRKLHGLP